jgi:hypothetical protein
MDNPRSERSELELVFSKKLWKICPLQNLLAIFGTFTDTNYLKSHPKVAAGFKFLRVDRMLLSG